MAVRKIKPIEPIKRILIEIVEHDSWSGPSVIETLEADSLDEAKDFCDDYNKKSCRPLKAGESVPDYYVTAEIKG